MAAYAGGNLAGAPAAKTGWVSCRLGIAAYIIPWIFTFSSALLLEGSVGMIIQSIVTAMIGCYALAGGVQGMFLDHKLSWYMRIVALCCALCMIISGTVTDLIGLALLVFIVLYVKVFTKHQKVLS